MNSLLKHIYYYSVGEIALPELQSATVTQTTTNVLDLVFDVAVDITTTGWTIASDGDAITITSVIADDGTTAPKFSLSRVVVPGEVLTLSYDATTGNTVASTGGAELATITDNAVTNDVHIILEVNFTGTTVDTTKGTITNPDSANLTISQNEKLLSTRTVDVAVADANTNYWQTVDSFTRGVFSVLLNTESGYTFSTWRFMYWVDASNFISIQNNNNVIRVAIQVSGAPLEYDLTTAIAPSNLRVKFIFNSSNEISFYYWNVNQWTQIGVTQIVNVGASAPIRFSSNSSLSDSIGDKFSFDTLRITDEDYTTELPEDYFL